MQALRTAATGMVAQQMNPALVQRLNSGLDRPLTLVLAPAGFGKTTLLAEWANQSPRRITWLTLDEGDNDLATFVGYFVTALQQLFPQACPGTQALLTRTRIIPAGNDRFDLNERDR